MNPEGLLNKIITGDENALRQLWVSGFSWLVSFLLSV